MCESHAGEQPLLLRKLIMKIYGRWIDDTLAFYLSLGQMSTWPVVGPVVRYFAGQYGRYIHGGRAATVEECLDLISRAAAITAVDCACRERSGNCSKPLRTCLMINEGAKEFGKIRKQDLISVAAAEEIITRSYSTGLIRTITHCVAPDVYAICNCCTCCCVPYRLRSEFGIDNAIVNGHKRAEINTEKCVNCGRCAEVCPEMAIGRDKSRVLSEKCLGCGLCLQACERQAIAMVDRPAKARTSPGLCSLVLIYTVFLGVILPMAVAHKVTQRYISTT